FFFFQAEDGIRDFHVTGVQTCALPIWVIPNTPVNFSIIFLVNAPLIPHFPASTPPSTASSTTSVAALVAVREASSPLFAFLLSRSEERRVGKECRSRRWSYDHEVHSCK